MRSVYFIIIHFESNRYRLFDQITRIYQTTTGKDSFTLLVLMATFFPLQGFFNCLIYLRPRYLKCKSRNPDAPVRRLMLLSLYHESHPIHGVPAAQGGIQQGGQGADGETEEERRRRRSSTASFYSMGNSKLRQGSGGESVDNDDINTVNAIASVSDYNNNNNNDNNNSRPKSKRTSDDRATLEKVEESSQNDAGEDEGSDDGEGDIETPEIQK